MTKRRGRGPALGTIQSLRRGLQLLDILADAGGQRPLGDLARRVGLNLSTAHHLIKTLEEQGYVVKEGRAYRLGTRLFRLAAVVWQEDELARLSEPVVVDLALKTRETARLAVFDRGQVVVIQKCDGEGPWRLFERLGAPRPAHCTALGKVLLAYQRTEIMRAHVAATELAAFTPRTITSEPQLLRDLRRVRRRGYATDAEEFTRGINCLAVPVFNFTGNVVAALGISGASWRLPMKDCDTVAATVKEMAERLSRDLGHAARGTTRSRSRRTPAS